MKTTEQIIEFLKEELRIAEESRDAISETDVPKSVQYALRRGCNSDIMFARNVLRFINGEFDD